MDDFGADREKRSPSASTHSTHTIDVEDPEHNQLTSSLSQRALDLFANRQAYSEEDARRVLWKIDWHVLFLFFFEPLCGGMLDS
jgi:hypothetical protein